MPYIIEPMTQADVEEVSAIERECFTTPWPSRVAQNLYRKDGMQVSGTRKRYYSDNGEDAYIMWSEPLTSPAFQERLARNRAAFQERLARQTAAEDGPPPIAVHIRSTAERNAGRCTYWQSKPHATKPPLPSC